MESTPVVGIIGGQRSNNTTPHHHYYTPEQPSSFISAHGGSYHLDGPGLRRGSNGILHPYGKPQHHPPSSRATPRSRGQSPSVNSLGPELMDSSLSPHIIGHGHNHLHDDSHIHINCDSSHSISPPNSNSNTTISCGSGNSTSANIGVPTRDHHRDSRNLRNGHHRSIINNNNNRSHHLKSKDSSEDYENFRNRTRSTGDKPKKKSILEDDEKSGGDDTTYYTSPITNKFKQRPPFINPNQEFLPICDALFNMISLAAYFCDVVFDVLTVYTWYKTSVQSEEDFELDNHHHHQQHLRNSHRLSSAEDFSEVKRSSMPRELMWQWSLLGLSFIISSAILSQVLSFKWYKSSERRGQKAPDGSDLDGPPPPCSSSILVVMHVSLLGVLWRYFKLFIPVDLRFVKNEVRDLCLLRLIHAFVEAAPMLLLQLYLIWHEPAWESVPDLTRVSTALSLFSVCWALASFSKNIRRQNVHKLVLTWLGVIFQFFWRLGTVSSRFLALSLYAVVYQYWVLVVLFLHWFCMLLWLISPKNIFHGEKMSPLRKVSYSAVVAVAYTFCYINVQETNSRTKVIIYYVTMFAENCLLLGVWLIAVRYEDEIWFRPGVTWAVFLCFGSGLFFMLLYYKYFHVKKLSYVYDAESSIYRNTSSIGGCSLADGSTLATISGGGGGDFERTNNKNGVIMGYRNGQNGGGVGGGSSAVIVSVPGAKKKGGKFNQKQKPGGVGKGGHGGKGADNGGAEGGGGVSRAAPLYNKINGHHIHHPNVPGVFNCRFHPAMKRKKKKPTSFVPPPAVPSTTAAAPRRSTQPPPQQQQQQQQIEVQQQQQRQIVSGELSSLSQEGVLRDGMIPAPVGHQQQQSAHQLIRASPGILNNSSTTSPPSSHPHPHVHHHLDSYEHNSNVSNTGIGNSSMSAHYDLPEGSLCYDPAGRGDGSASSSYGPMYPVKPPPGSGRMMNPFWRRPLSLTMGSENEGSVSSRIDIQQKLQEKKQQQLAELREIEEEIKQGKLKRPELHEIIPQPVNARQPIPIEKKQPWFNSSSGEPPVVDLSLRPPILLPGSDEILLDPQYLMYSSPGGIIPSYVDNGSGFYYNPDWPVNYYEPLYQNGIHDDSGGTSPPSAGASGDGGGGGGGEGGRVGDRRRRHGHQKGYFDPSSRESIYKSYRIPSDIDSQMSLPRSYTLPREFKYKRKFRKPVKTENFLPSTNSSDGDVDSGGDDPERYSQVRPYPLPSMHHITTTNSTTTASPPGVAVAAAVPPPPPGSAVQLQPAARSSRKAPNTRPRHKLHETKL